MFADTGIPRMIDALKAAGGDGKRMVVRLTGGAQVLDSQGVFQIGKRNYLAARKILWKAGILVAAEAVGGEVSQDHASRGRLGPLMGAGRRRHRAGAGASNGAKGRNGNE